MKSSTHQPPITHEYVFSKKSLSNFLSSSEIKPKSKEGQKNLPVNYEVVTTYVMEWDNKQADCSYDEKS